LAASSAATLVVAAAASAWSFLAAQSPSSPLHVGPLAGPIDSLARACWLAGAVGLSLAAVLTIVSMREADERRTLRLLALGWIILLGAMVAGAILGTTGTQVIKAYPRTVAVMLAKFAGFAALLAGLLSLLVGLLRRPRS
jgi:NAD/NADP transhydrogenase beta subunit